MNFKKKDFFFLKDKAESQKAVVMWPKRTDYYRQYPATVQTQKHKAKVGFKRRTKILMTKKDKVTVYTLPSYQWTLSYPVPSHTGTHLRSLFMGPGKTVCLQSVNSSCLKTVFAFYETEHIAQAIGACTHAT